MEEATFKVWTNWKDVANRQIYFQYRKRYSQAFNATHAYLNPSLFRMLRNEYRYAVIRLLVRLDEADEHELQLRLPPSWFGKKRSEETDRRVKERQVHEAGFQTLYWRNSVSIEDPLTWASKDLRRRVRELLLLCLDIRIPYSIDLWVEWEGEQQAVKCCIRSRVLKNQV